MAGSAEAQTVEHLAKSHSALAVQAWQTWRIKDTHKGPLVWHEKHVLVHIKDEQRLPEGPYHLLVCYHPLTGEIKYFLSNAPTDTPVETLLRVAFGRWRIERCFEDGKGEVGLDHWEGRRWLGLKRHLILTTVSYLFLAQARQRLAEKKFAVDGLPGAGRSRCTDPRGSTPAALAASACSLARPTASNTTSNATPWHAPATHAPPFANSNASVSTWPIYHAAMKIRVSAVVLR